MVDDAEADLSLVLVGAAAAAGSLVTDSDAVRVPNIRDEKEWNAYRAIGVVEGIVHFGNLQLVPESGMLGERRKISPTLFRARRRILVLYREHHWEDSY
jgi:hypothetical protein